MAPRTGATWWFSAKNSVPSSTVISSTSDAPGDGGLMAKGRCTDAEAADALTPIRGVGPSRVEVVLLNRMFSGHVSRPEVAIVGPLVGGVVLLAGLISGKSVSAVTAVAVVSATATYLFAKAVLRWQAADQNPGRGVTLRTARVNDRRPS